MNRLLLFSAILAFLFGCKVDQRNIERMQVYAVRYPNQFKTLSNTLDPCFTGPAKSDTTFLPGKADTVLLPSEVIKGEPGNPDTIRLPGKKITVTNRVVIHDTVTNDRALQAIRATFNIKSDSLVVVKTQLNQVKHSRSIWMWTAIGAIFLIVIYIVARVVIFFNGGGIASILKKV